MGIAMHNMTESKKNPNIEKSLALDKKSIIILRPYANNKQSNSSC